MKSKVKLNLARLSVPEKIVKGNFIVSSMTGNANFPSPIPPLADISAAVTALDTAYNNAQSGGQAQTIIMHQKEEDLDTLLTKLVLYVEQVADGNAVIILSAGMDVRNNPEPIGELPAVANLSAKTGSQEGEVDLEWNAVHGAKAYVVQKCADPIDIYLQVAISTKSKCTVRGLGSGTKYWFRVAAVGAAGQGDFSDPATARAK